MILLKNNWVKTLIITVIILFSSKYEVYADEKKDILFISSYNPNFVTFNDQVIGIEDGMDNDVQLQIEYMDFRNFSGEENENNFYNLLKYKISNYKDFDAIILGDDKALKFGTKYKNELFPDIPIVSLGVNSIDNLNIAIKDYGIYGVAELYSLEENLKLALDMNKDCKNVILLDASRELNIDNDIFGSINYSMIEEYVLNHPDKNFQIIYSEDMSYDEFTNLLCNFTKDDIVICAYPYMFNDKSELTYKELIELVSETVKVEVPFYCFLAYGIGDGFLRATKQLLKI